MRRACLHAEPQAPLRLASGKMGVGGDSGAENRGKSEKTGVQTGTPALSFRMLPSTASSKNQRDLDHA